MVIVSNFVQTEVAQSTADPPIDETHNMKDIQGDETETLPVKRKKAPKEKDNEGKRKSSKEKMESKKLKSKKKSKRVKVESDDDV